MLRALHANFCAQAPDRARLPGLPRGKMIFAARWVVTVLAFWVVLRSIDLGAVVDLIGRAAPLALGVAVLVVIAQFAVLVWRWQLVIHILGGKAVGFGPLALFLGHSCLIGQVLPSSVGGRCGADRAAFPIDGGSRRRTLGHLRPSARLCRPRSAGRPDCPG